MEILINELSLHEQFATVDEFVDVAVKPLILLLQQIDSERDILLKKYDFWSANVTATATLRDIFKGSYSRTNDEIRRSKTQLAALMDNPYWEDNRKHNTPDTYQHNAKNVFDTSLAESCERDKVLMSFVSDRFNSTLLIIEKNLTSISIDNLIDNTHFYTLVRTRGLVVDFSLSDTSRFKKTHFNVQGKIVYKELSTKYYWYEDNLHHSHYEVFNQNEEHIGIADISGNVDVSKRVDGRKLFD
jgi:hypothetical protein